MKQISFKKLLPHLIAIAIFLVIALIFCKPSFESDLVLQQGDIAGWEGMSHQSFQYREAHGHFPLWTSSMFSGMPAFQIAMDGPWSPLSTVHSILTLWLPTPVSFFFLACIAFYFLCQCLRIRPWASVLGAVAFAYCTFDPIIITAGHNTQMFALAYAPALLGAVILLFEKKYISGFVLTTLFTALEILQNHQQISYYLFIVILAMTIAYVIRWIKAGEFGHLAKALSFAAIAAVIGVMANANNLFPLFDYSKESKRAGQLVISDSKNNPDKVADGKTTGLSKDYAFQWSYGKMESFSLMFPGIKGYGLYHTARDGEDFIFPKLDENSNMAKYLTEKMNIPEDQAANYAFTKSGTLYWGDQTFGTNGPVYLGAIICFLFIFGLFYLDNKHKWWILSVSIFAILLAWGNHLPGFNYFMFDHLPFYNKFRVPTMTLVIPQLLFPMIAALAINKLMDGAEDDKWKKFKWGTIATAVVFAAITMFYFSADFSRENKERTKGFNTVFNPADPAVEMKLDSLNRLYLSEPDNQLYEDMMYNMRGQDGSQQKAKGLISALRKDRASLLIGSLFRSFIFVLIAVALIALYIKKKLNATLLVAGLTLATVIDLLTIDMNYMNEKSFDTKDKFLEAEHPQTDADRTILKDPDPNYRVFNMSGGGDPFQESKTSYFHKSIGGYHPAKLGIYDDLASYQLSGSPNMRVVNMLNAKYIIQSGAKGVPTVSRNQGALGNCWFVKGVRYVNGPVAEMKALNDLDPKDSAVLDEQFRKTITAFTPADSISTIRQTAFDNDAIQYESNATGSHLAIFSEIFYKDWKAYIDGKPADIAKANYVLRGLVVPAGKHLIDFKFEPTAYLRGQTFSRITSWLLTLLILGYIFWLVRPLLAKSANAQ